MNKHKAFGFGLVAVCASVCSASFAQSLTEQYPVSEHIQLSDGTLVSMPFHVSGNLTTAFLSIINTKQSAKFIANKAFEPIEIECDGKGTNQSIGVLYFQDITSSPVGAYAETVNTIAVRRKSAPELELPCLPVYASNQEKMSYLLAAQQIMAQANSVNMQQNLPSDYAMYNQDLELNNLSAIRAGIEIWGYPKSLADFNYRISEHYVDLQVTNIPDYTPVIELSYLRKVGMQTPLYSVGDNVLPQRFQPSSDKHAQLPGILSSESGWVQPFIGYFWAGHSSSKTAKALRKTEFYPVAVVEYTQVKGTALPLYAK
ncbi:MULTISPECIES: hypothetical protein [Pseudoalteromonas]|uniref:Uncharacterized protein n=1 Tax=Pseudoalteromonas amylolytica TaxID=1859457 RepID=A0A1S1MVK8_9GAMM|nr:MULTISPECIES: hypothetical protein [Pseudoalteromonas]OHU85462.1 hypothetical protein BFC16_19115 [Pseudoalteromonas sp. JW3]OHU92917.1 hypothetical protein BET10_02600 [Pseudoalteromonas amylolytica]